MFGKPQSPQFVLANSGGEGAYGALDAVGGSFTEEVLDSVRQSGRVLLYGVLGGTEVKFNAVKLLYQVCLPADAGHGSSYVLTLHDPNH